nr:immunoglobulin light chain junction region [Macaca mulatta]MOV78987.1 immunoglobulin light chain junction region [Macaca mulatta]MOV80350.1 immunoglobulin light chain junction region [Macaca mulatta]MOV81586.1 immunoglobulin light chain junction region [Macaca mulatta]MOV85192.1 immunoglobulin light chain junction region [Macaca mulatta]
CMQSLEIPPSF